MTWKYDRVSWGFGVLGFWGCGVGIGVGVGVRVGVDTHHLEVGDALGVFEGRDDAVPGDELVVGDVHEVVEDEVGGGQAHVDALLVEELPGELVELLPVHVVDRPAHRPEEGEGEEAVH